MIPQVTQSETPCPQNSIGRVYLMDLWSFIPYYMAHLYKALRRESVDAVLGSVQYHLDREYFHNAGIETDPDLFDFGGKVKIRPLRRAVKSLEYFLNLVGLGLRSSFWPDSMVLHVQFLPFLEKGLPIEIWFLTWMHLLGVRIVYTVHNLADRDSRVHSTPLFGAAYRIADAIICHGKEARDKLVNDFGVSVEKIRIIPHGPLFAEKPRETRSESRTKLGLPEDETLVLCAGVITKYKGIPFLLDAWKRLADSGTKARLLIAGTGEHVLLNQIRDKVTKCQLESSVSLWLHFIPVETLPYLYQAADILIYPYEAGTTSGALMTGMNYDKAIIATSIPFFAEHLTHQRDALLVDYGDVNKLESALVTLIEASDERARLASAVAKHKDMVDGWNRIARLTTDCYQAVLQRTVATNS